MFVVGDPPASMSTGKGGKCPVSIASRVRVQLVAEFESRSMVTSMSLSSALEVLANYRTTNTRASQDIFEKGIVVLKAGSTATLGDEGASMYPANGIDQTSTLVRMGFSRTALVSGH